MKIKKILTLILLLIVIAATYFYLLPNEAIDEQDDRTDYSKQENELYVYEFEAESEDECTSVEQFDNDAQVCYFECETDQECDELLDAAKEELDSYLEEYEEGSSKRQETKPQDDNDIVSDADYSVDSNENITLQSGEEAAAHIDTWNQIKAISPDSFSASYIETFRAYTSPDDDTIAYVVDDNDNGKFIIAVNLAALSESSPQERTLTFVHELAHIVTLNKDQLDMGSCEYETDEGCFGDKSLLANFVGRFWSDKDVEASKNGEDLYSGRSSDFVTQYAATNPEEDISESFAYYTVKSSYSSGDVASKKQSFFDDFDYVKDIKQQMRKATLNQFIRARISR